MRKLMFLCVVSALMLSACGEKDDAENMVYFNCGETGVQAVFANERMKLNMQGQQYELIQAVSASGARYEGPSDQGSVQFWNKGKTADLQIGDVEYPICHEVVFSREESEMYRALGTEPFWNITFTPADVHISFMGQSAERLSRSDMQQTRDDRGYGFEFENGRIVVEYADKETPCSDNMSNRIYPDHVTLEWQGDTYHGCGMPFIRPDLDDLRARMEQRASLNEGRIDTLNGADNDTVEREIISPYENKKWIITALGDEKVDDEAGLTLNFSDDGRLSGNGGCNQFSGHYEIKPDRLYIDHALISTRRACVDESRMQLENIYFSLLPTMVDILTDRYGHLVLDDGYGTSITAAPAETEQD